MIWNRYMDEGLNEVRLQTQGHRNVVGGLWERLGALQLGFLMSEGLCANDRVLDVGCGALRAGVPLCRYLEPRRYFGIDISRALITAGFEQEIVPQGLSERLPRSHLHVTSDYEVPFKEVFDFGLATSLFTHLPLEEFTRCMAAVAPHFRPGARFYATVFEGAGITEQLDGVRSHDDRDPFHFTQSQLTRATPIEWALQWIGDWNHPRGQKMVKLTRV